MFLRYDNDDGLYWPWNDRNQSKMIKIQYRGSWIRIKLTNNLACHHSGSVAFVTWIISPYRKLNRKITKKSTLVLPLKNQIGSRCHQSWAYFQFSSDSTTDWSMNVIGNSLIWTPYTIKNARWIRIDLNQEGIRSR